MPHSSPTKRRHDLDALRAIAMLLGIVLHIGLAYTPIPWPVQDTQQSEIVLLFIAYIHGFRMPLFFLLSGFFTAMLLQRKGIREMLKQRVMRILLPLLLCTITILPLTRWSIELAENSHPNQINKKEVEKQNSSSLWMAAKNGDMEILKKELADKNINTQDPIFKVTPLNWAVLNNQTEIVKFLIKQGADVNKSNSDGSTPLHSALFLGRYKETQLLLEQKADLKQKNSYGASALESIKADWSLVKYMSDMLDLKVDPKTLEDNRRKTWEVIQKHHDFKDTSFEFDAQQKNPIQTWILSLYEKPLFSKHTFNHLWFLWHLCWIIPIYILFHKLFNIFKLPKANPIFVHSPLKYLWIVPLSLIPQFFMGIIEPNFGPDLSAGLLPFPHILCFYIVFFFFGSLIFNHAQSQSYSGKWWWMNFCLASFVVFPIGLEFSFGGFGFRHHLSSKENYHLISSVFQVLFAWLMIFSSIDFFTRFFSKENKVLRYISESSYWLYIIHLPLVFLFMNTMKTWEAPLLIKFFISLIVIVGISLMCYQFFVRKTWLGLLLNGRRILSTKKSS